MDVVERTRLYHLAIADLDFEAIAAMFSPGAFYVSNGVGSLSGRDAILQAFRDYFAIYPDQEAQDELIEAVSVTSARSLWRLSASDSRTGERVNRSGEEIIVFDAEGLIERVEVSDRPLA